MKKLFLLTILILSLTILVKPLSIYSQTSSSQDYRLEQIEKLSATASTKVATSSAKTKSHSISFTSGTVISSANSVIYLATKEGTKTIYTSESTLYYNIDSSGKKLIGIGDLKSGDTVEVIGLPSKISSGSAKIIVRDQTKIIKNFSLIGKVLEISSTSLKIANLNRADLPNITTVLNNETTFANNRTPSLKISDILINDKVTLTGYFDDKGNLVTKQVFKISSSVNKTATSSAK